MFEKFGWSVTNEVVRRRAGIEMEFESRVDQSIEMVWTHGKNCMSLENCTARRLVTAEVEYGVDRG